MNFFHIYRKKNEIFLKYLLELSLNIKKVIILTNEIRVIQERQQLQSNDCRSLVSQPNYAYSPSSLSPFGAILPQVFQCRHLPSNYKNTTALCGLEQRTHNSYKVETLKKTIWSSLVFVCFVLFSIILHFYYLILSFHYLYSSCTIYSSCSSLFLSCFLFFLHFNHFFPVYVLILQWMEFLKQFPCYQLQEGKYKYSGRCFIQETCPLF